MASINFYVTDANSNPLEGATVTVSGQPLAAPKSNPTPANGKVSIAVPYGAGGQINWNVTASGYQSQSGTVAQPFWPWQNNSVNVVLPLSPVNPVDGVCPLGYTIDPATGLCAQNATANVWSNLVTGIESLATEIVIGGIVIGAGVILWVHERNKDKSKSQQSSFGFLKSLVLR